MSRYVTDRWQRELRSGVKAFATLWLDKADAWHFDVKFVLPPDAPTHREVGEIADEFMEVLNKREAPLSMFPLERNWLAEVEQDERAS